MLNFDWVSNSGPNATVCHLSPDRRFRNLAKNCGSGRLGPARAEVGLGFALLGWFRRFRPPPPPLVWFRVRRPSLFFFLAFSGFCPFWARCVVLVFALPSSLAFPSSRPG